VPAVRNIAVLVGSLRKASLTRHAAHALMTVAPESMLLGIVEIGQLPHYNQDQDEEGSPLAPWAAFREEIKPADAVLFVTPEYNRSVPGVLKNAIDVGSRPHGHSVWDKKPAAILSVSPGAIGGFGANHHLRQSLVFLNMPILQQPEAYIGRAATLFSDDGSITNEMTEEFFRDFMERFAAWIEINLAAR
jgi:chromate reductase, NAD(P)H dehydrogenase (quinone)